MRRSWVMRFRPELSMTGMLGPDVGTSSPTRPRSASARARLTATVDLPTPPLPLATAMMLRTPGSPAPAGVGVCAGFAAGPGSRHMVSRRFRAVGHHARDLVADLVDQVRRVGRRATW
jgi:hypothetical protein